MRVFAEGSLSDFLGRRNAELAHEVQQEPADRLLNINETQYAEYLVHKHSVQPLVLDFAGVTVSDREEMVEAKRHPRSQFDLQPGEVGRYPRQVITCHIPFSGDRDLLRYAPSSRLNWSIEVSAQQDCVCFDIINWTDQADEIRSEAQHALDNFRRQAESVTSEVDSHNRRIEAYARQVVQDRKQLLLRRANILASLDVGVRKREGVPSTFAVPVQKVSLEVRKPQAAAGPYRPEWTLDPDIYEGILTILSDLGVEMERHPSIYHGKDEEALRDLYLMFLAPHFQSATGETFNQSGRTDILIRHEKSNVFIAECKFWPGEKRYQDAISQLLSYLTWRDSKAAILCFVKNKEFAPVLTKIEAETPKHPWFVKYKAKRREGWYDYEFHLPGDPSRSVFVAVLCFHLPGHSHTSP